MDASRMNKIILCVEYEWRQLNDMAKALATYEFRIKELPSGGWSAFVESFVVHARNLINMLWREKQHPSDVTATDFLQDPSCWSELRGSGNPSEVNEIVTKINKQVAHLTYDRIEYAPEDFLWDVQKVVELIRDPMDKLTQKTQQEGVIELLGPAERVFLVPSNTYSATAATTSASTPGGDCLSTHGRTGS